MFVSMRGMYEFAAGSLRLGGDPTLFSADFTPPTLRETLGWKFTILVSNFLGKEIVAEEAHVEEP